MAWMCVSTVFGLRKSFLPMPAFERPSAISSSTDALALGQLLDRVVGAAAAEELRDDLGVDRGAAARRRAARRRGSRRRRARGP